MENDKGILASIVDAIMGGEKTRALRTKPAAAPAQSNNMVKAAAEEARRRAVERGQLADLDPNAAAILKKPKTK